MLRFFRGVTHPVSDVSNLASGLGVHVTPSLGFAKNYGNPIVVEVRVGAKMQADPNWSAGMAYIVDPADVVKISHLNGNPIWVAELEEDDLSDLYL